jgi:hypothetical protein
MSESVAPVFVAEPDSTAKRRRPADERLRY